MGYYFSPHNSVLSHLSVLHEVNGVEELWGELRAGEACWKLTEALPRFSSSKSRNCSLGM